MKNRVLCGAAYFSKLLSKQFLQPPITQTRAEPHTMAG
jgi:hypothetical protein